MSRICAKIALANMTISSHYRLLVSWTTHDAESVLEVAPLMGATPEDVICRAIDDKLMEASFTQAMKRVALMGVRRG